MFNRVPGLIWLILILAQAVQPQSGGTIKGVVVDEQGKPVTKAEIHIAEIKSFVGHRLVEMHETDGQGQFVIDNIPWGTYFVMAGKEEAGYPDTRFAFYSNLAVPTVTLQPSFRTATLTVPLGPKAGILEVSPTDAETQKRIAAASITLKRKDNPSFHITMSADEKRILVPSLVDILAEISASGYETAFYPSSSDPSQSTPIHLSPGQELKLAMPLLPHRKKTTVE
jgi:hypothetical protein